MPKKTSREIVLRIYQLRQTGLSVGVIVDKLAEEFVDSVPSEATVSRHCRAFTKFPPEELAEDVPFSWGTMTDVPWNESPRILRMWARYLGTPSPEQFGQFTRRLAKWVWRVSTAVGFDMEKVTDSSTGFEEVLPVDLVYAYAPTFKDVIQIASEYSWREIAHVVLEEPFVTQDLDLMLAFLPWQSNDSLLRYQMARDDEGARERVLWHRWDLRWLWRVVPEVAPLVYRERQLRSLNLTLSDIGLDDPKKRERAASLGK